MPYHCFKTFGQKICSFRIDKLTFHHSANNFFIGREQQRKRCITSYYTNMHYTLMHMYCASNVDMPECFRAEFSHFILRTRITI